MFGIINNRPFSTQLHAASRRNYAIFAIYCLALISSLVFFSAAHAVTTSGNATNGAALWLSYGCNGCHGATPRTRQLNAANASNVIDWQITNGMPVNPTATERKDIAAYIATFVPNPNPANLAVPYNSPGTAFIMPNIWTRHPTGV